MAPAGLGERETCGWGHRQVDGLKGTLTEVPAQQVPSRAFMRMEQEGTGQLGHTAGPRVLGGWGAEWDSR